MSDTLEPPSRLTDDEVFVFLDRALTNMIERKDVKLGPGERGRLYGWYWGYYGRAAVDLYLATGETRFARLVERTIESLLDERDDQLGMIDDERHVAFPGWGTRYKSGERSNEITTAGLITLPMLEYARATQTTWIADAAVQTLLAFQAERTSTAANGHYFAHQTQHIVEALNHAALYGAALTKASLLFDDPWLIETSKGLYDYHLSFVDQRGDGVSWPYAPAPDQDKSKLPSEAIWKAAATIELPVALAESGDATAKSFLADVARSLSTHPTVSRGDFPQFIGHDRRNAIDPARVSGGLTSFIAAFVQTNDSSVNELLFSLMSSRPELFPNGWKGGSRAMIMAWAHLRKTEKV